MRAKSRRRSRRSGDRHRWPVDAFWSLAVYDAEDYLVPNEAEIYSVGHLVPVVLNPDGSLGLTLQQHDPGPGVPSPGIRSVLGEPGVVRAQAGGVAEAMAAAAADHAALSQSSPAQLQRGTSRIGCNSESLAACEFCCATCDPNATCS
ncbi:DUF1214 domain-containing protein [Nocardia sp. NPDC051900]|uniref:DUF1214 domain-containing protein n=1 Tax=Nocardia sp. NPDC051900 TaxID=3364326 RepID=UPI0037B6D9A7